MQSHVASPVFSRAPCSSKATWFLEAMSTSADTWQGWEHDPDLRCARCEQVTSGEWINGQRCWSTPYHGDAGESMILAHTSVSPVLDKPIMLRLLYPATEEGIIFWCFFCVCQMSEIPKETWSGPLSPKHY